MSPITCPWPRVFRRLEPLVAETRAPSSRMWLRRWPLPHAAVLRHPRMVSLNQRLAMKSHLPKGGGTTLKTRLLNKYDNIKVYQGYHFILGKSWKCECAYENGRFFIAKFFSPRRATQSSIFIHTNCHLIFINPKTIFYEMDDCYMYVSCFNNYPLQWTLWLWYWWLLLLLPGSNRSERLRAKSLAPSRTPARWSRPRCFRCSVSPGFNEWFD